jgi:hypothetical protein
MSPVYTGNPANNSLEHSASGTGPGMRRQLRVKEKIGEPGKACEGAIPGRSLVPAAQAQPGAASTQLAAVSEPAKSQPTFA